MRLGDELELNLIELPKADRMAGIGDFLVGGGASAPLPAALAAWVTFMEHWQEESRMAQIDYPPVQQALMRVRELSADEETRRLAFVRERALRDEREALQAAREQGEREGERRGELRGELRGEIRGENRGELRGEIRGKLLGESAILERLLTRRFGPLNDTLRARLAAADAAQLERWADRLLEATTLEGVFAS